MVAHGVTLFETYLKIVAVIILSQMLSGSSFRSTICTVALRPIMYLTQSAGQEGEKEGMNYTLGLELRKGAVHRKNCLHTLLLRAQLGIAERLHT